MFGYLNLASVGNYDSVPPFHALSLGHETVAVGKRPDLMALATSGIQRSPYCGGTSRSELHLRQRNRLVVVFRA